MMFELPNKFENSAGNRRLPVQGNPPEPVGTTLYERIPLGQEAPAKAQTGIFLPVGYQPRPQVDLIIYLHGMKAPSGLPTNATIDRYWSPPFPFRLREVLNASGRNVILVAPTLGPASEAGSLTRPGGLDRYVNQVLDVLVKRGPYKAGAQPPRVGNLIIAGHSAGGKVLRALAQRTNRYSANLREIWGFDCLYGRSDAAFWRQWCAAHRAVKLFVYFLNSTASHSKDLQGNGNPRIPPPPNVLVQRSGAAGHNLVPAKHLKDLITAASFLQHRLAPHARVAAESKRFNYELAGEVGQSKVNRASSNYIRWVQQALNRILGLQLVVDGDAGIKTRSAIRSFQTQRGLLADGIVGSKTEAALIAAGAGPAPGVSRSSASAPACAPNIYVDCPAPGTTPTEVLDNFAHDSASLNRPRHKPQINRIASQIVSSQSTPQPIRSVLIAGHTDPTGSDDYNFDLARRRAETVARELCITLGPGLAAKIKFTLTSCGERQLKATPELSRRVEIFLPKAVAPPPQPQPTPQPPQAGPCTFRPSRDGFKFTNYFTLPSQITVPLNYLGIPVGAGAYGLCGGMSFLAADYFSYGLAIPGTSTVPSTGSSLYNKLLGRQLDSLNLNVDLSTLLGGLVLPGAGILTSSFALPVLKFWTWMGLADTGRGSVAQKTASEVAVINPLMRRSKFAVLGLVLVNRSGSLSENHQVLAYCLTQRAPNDLVYSIYDPNHPRRDDIRIEVKIVRGEAQVTHVVGAGSASPVRTPVRGFFNMSYSAVRP